ncbi:prepilin-type N-terminal cleavage/methylation domain-containing protein [Candidatus Dependentiae bacterium]|nr:prepilin-type N-terminal cleavage/methylation domain-containing protein [Candidatus Dependentiae bacterium]
MLNKMQMNNKGISFIEILIVLFILGLISSFVIPSIFNKQKDSAKQKFVVHFMELMQDALEHTIISQQVHQIFFDLEKHEIMVKIPDALNFEPDAFVSVGKEVAHRFIQIPDHFVVKNFFINGIDDIQGAKGIKTVWFYIMPDGTSQAVIINIEDAEVFSEQNRFSFTINPFYSQVKKHDEFQKP